jgi:uncharacterized protein
MSERPAFYPGRALIEAYGNGGFRFAGMSHRGSLLILPSGISAWDVTDVEHLTLDDLLPVLAEDRRPELLLLGTGRSLVRPSQLIRSAFADAGVGLEPMDTGAAARTYNVLLAEGRAVGAALIAVP